MLAITGSMATGKSTAASLLAEQGLPLHDSDSVVHRLYEGEMPDVARAQLDRLFPGCLKNNRIDRRFLSEVLAGMPEKLSSLEAIVHPIVRDQKNAFLTKMKVQGFDWVVLDIPLLFESGVSENYDRILVTIASVSDQMERLRARDGFSESSAQQLLSRQLPQREKIIRADYVLDSSLGMEYAEAFIAALTDDLRNGVSPNQNKIPESLTF